MGAILRTTFEWIFVIESFYKNSMKLTPKVPIDNLALVKIMFFAEQVTICYMNQWLLQLISPYCRIYASVNGVSIGSDNGLSHHWFR